MESERNSQKTWFGRYTVDEGRGSFLHLGALKLWIAHFPSEWRIAVEQGLEPLIDDYALRCPVAIEEPPPGVEIHRFASRQSGARLTLEPMLADRPVVARPEVPFHLLPGDEANLFISTAVWLRISVGDPRMQLMEIPSVRSSDTWFGPSTREGELCYAARTAARMNLDNVLLRPERAITSVVLRNRADDMLLLERISLPVTALSLFKDAGGNLWTEEVTVERDREGKMAAVRLGKAPPSEAKETKRISEARLPQDRNVFVKALDSLLR